MSSQYYKFLNRELLNYFKDSHVRPGDRYFLILNSDNELNNLKKAIVNSNEENLGDFKSHEFDFETIYYNLNNLNVIFVFANDGITHDFLVTIRNKVSLQKDEWSNSIVVFMIKEDLDSITGGALDLSKKGAPFHTASLRKNLNHILENNHNNLEEYEKSILDFVVKNKFGDEFVKYTLMDFEAVFSIIEQGQIIDQDYYNLGIFKDKQLKSFKGTQVEKRLEENKQLFDSVQSIHDRGNVKEQIEEKFAGNTTNYLTSNNWYDTDFEYVKRSKESADELKRIKLDFLEDEFLSQFDDMIEVWDKPSGNTKVKTRERNIIIFKNHQILKDIKLPFSKNTDLNSIHVIKRGIKLLNLTENNQEAKVNFKTRNKSNLIIDCSNLNGNDEHFFEFTYKHDNKNTLTFKFRILIVNFDSSLIENIKTRYKLKYDSKSKLVEINLDSNENILSFNNNNQDIKKIYNCEEKYSLTTYSKFDFSPLINKDEDQINLYLLINNVTYKVKLNDIAIKPTPVSSLNLIRYVYEQKDSMKVKDNLVTHGTNEYYLYKNFKNVIQIEREMLANNFTNGEIIGSKFYGENLDLNPKILQNYQNFCDLIIKKESVPSLIYYDDEIMEAGLKYCESVEEELNNLADNEKIIDNNILNIHKLGLIDDGDHIYFTSLHPLLIRYEIEKTKQLKEQKINEKVFRKYNPVGLLPFFVDNNSNYYFANLSEESFRWIVYKPYETTNKMSADKTRFIIKSRLYDFKQHFKYLFSVNPSFSLKTKYVEVNDYKVILQGTIEFLLNEIRNSKSLHQVNPIDIYINKNDNLDFMYELYNLKSYNELQDLYDVFIPSKVKKDYEEEDIIDAIKEKINIFVDNEKGLYHITFYNFNQDPQFSTNNMKEINASVTDRGLLSSISYTKLGKTYLSGFGIAGIREATPLIQSATLWNSFIASNQNHQLNPFKHNEGIVNNVISLENKNLDYIFDNTNWVTFLDPSVDLSYFNSDQYDLYVIHYNDQTSSFNYESITVTNDTHQYGNVLKEFLTKVNVDYTPQNIENIIRSFNILNGEWLLSVIGNRSSKNIAKDQSVREKLSIISAYKQVLAVLDNEKIKWIPISLEEVIRVSRQQGLEASSDIFSAKELGYNGTISDDLLFIGLENTEGIFKIHLMPVEVKVGLKNSGDVEKAKNQVVHLFNLLNEELITTSNKNLTQNYYRQFFLNLYFGNVKKFLDNGVLEDNELINLYNRRAEILNTEVYFTSELNLRYGKGLIVLFNEDNNYRKLVLNDEPKVIELNLTELDAYVDSEKEFSTLKNEIHNNEKGIDINQLLTNQKFIDNQDDKMRDTKNRVDNEQLKSEKTSEEDTSSKNFDSDGRSKNDNSNGTNVNDQKDYDKKFILEDIRILLGKIKGSNQNLYWEFGHPKLPNRHLLISGKSGQGKTYFMQCLLYEMAKNQLDSLIVDYTDGFLETHLEPEFLSKLGNKVETKFIFKDKLPINPFKKYEIDLGGFTLPEENDDIADRVVQIVDFVFKLGIQQSSLLKETIKIGLDKYGDDFTFTKLKLILANEESTNAISLIGRISKLLDKDPFVYNDTDFSWSNVFNNQGKVHIMQLKGFVPDIQKIITEFLLWDMYNYTEREGNKNSPVPVLLDEMQNLNHKESSPTTKILKEGRKFGWSSWLATQSISSIKNSNGDISALFNAAQQIHFAPPEDQIPFISKNIATNNEERRRVEQNLSNLNKGQCIVNGYSKINGELKKVVETIDVVPLEYRD